MQPITSQFVSGYHQFTVVMIESIKAFGKHIPAGVLLLAEKLWKVYVPSRQAAVVINTIAVGPRRQLNTGKLCNEHLNTSRWHLVSAHQPVAPPHCIAKGA